MVRKDHPVFFDHTGKRWLRTKWILAATAVSIGLLAGMAVPLIARPVDLGNGQTAALSPSAVDDLKVSFNSTNVPVVGQGQFIRAVEVTRSGQSFSIKDVFSGQQIRELAVDEEQAVSDSRYALERYGKLPDKQIVLTFDDGPDAAFTPPLLDLLSDNGVPAAFFVVGANVVKHPEIAQRIIREGHVAANHTFSHIDFEYDGTAKGAQEINQTQHVMRAATGHHSAFMRVPYGGNTDESQRDNVKGILQAQRLGYVPVAFDHDTDDWKFKSNHSPEAGIFDGSGKILLLHDSGGDRSYTIDYVKKLIPMAKKAGYTFVGLDQAYPGEPLQKPVTPDFADKAAFATGQAVLVWPARFVRALFAFSVFLTVFITVTNITLAIVGRRRRALSAPRNYRPPVSIIVPAFNEAAVLEETVKSLLRSDYRNLGVVVVDDGSTDGTLQVARKLAAGHARVKVVHQANSGKASALNNGIENSTGEIIICVDADTVFERSTVSRLVAHFYDPSVGGVAGYVRVGNMGNMLARWQALEYITSIALERAAQAFLGAITVVPGACGAWRRSALTAAGGFSNQTLAEDCDVALAVHCAGYRITQETSAISYTECPLSLGDLAKQRFRWTFGNIQSYWKHRGMFFNKRFGWLGSFVLPNAALSILVPMLFWPLLLGVTVANILAGRWWAVFLFLLIIMVFQFIVAWIGLALAKERPWYLSAVPLTKLVYGPLRTYILYRSLLTVLRGALVGWNKLRRTRTVNVPRRAQPSRAVRQAVEEPTN